MTNRVPKIIDLSTESLEALFAADDQIYVRAVFRSLAPDMAREILRLRHAAIAQLSGNAG